jgi:uncharacterized protein YyaL (SSP411 family)
MLLETLWRVGGRSGNVKLNEAFTLALERMSNGGIYDHVGGGFARYSTDAKWLVPHFEKMLYDNALLLELLALAWHDSGNALFSRRAAETVDWLAREMRLPGGGFAASLDADSPGGEGAFYVWTPAELEAVLGAEDAAFFAHWYDITPAGNWEHGRSIANRSAHPVASEAEEARLAGLRARLLAHRDGRPRPARDDKALADWNGMTIAALAVAGMAFERPDWIALGTEAFQFVVARLERDGRLGHSWKDDQLVFPGFAADLAAMARAAAALAEATGETRYLDHAASWLDALWRLHWADGILYMTAADADALVVRPQALQDDATPSAAGLAADAMQRLAVLSGEELWRGRSEELLAGVVGRTAQFATQHLTIVNALDLRLGGVEIVVTGQGEAADALAAAARSVPFPIRILHRIRPGDSLAADHPAAALLDGGQPRALACAGDRCGLPVQSAADLLRSVSELRGVSAA